MASPDACSAERMASLLRGAEDCGSIDWSMGARCMGKGSYLGGHSVIDKGWYGDPEGRGISPNGSPALSGSRRMPDAIIAPKLPYARDALGVLVALSDAKKVRLHNIAQIRKWSCSEFLSRAGHTGTQGCL